MKTDSLYEALLKYKAKKNSSFHTPGHKCNFFKNLEDLDYTELKETDDLYNPAKSILKTEKIASKIFKSGASLISAGGCTLCIQAMVALFCNYGSKIICSRIIHKSAVNTMALLNITPIWLYPKIDKKTSFYTPPESNEIEALLNNNKDISAVYITSPDYYGTIADIFNISKICKKHNVPLIVDNAHGSHLTFLKPNIHPLNLGADATADSIHKTLPALTGSAMLHLKDKKYFKKAKSLMEFFGSSSPSFTIMASMDLCLKWIKLYAEKEFLNLEKKVLKINNLAKSKGLIISNFKKDSTRICFNLNNVFLTSYDFYNHLKKYKVEPEFYNDKFMVLIPSPFNTKLDFARLEKALKELPKKSTNLHISKSTKGLIKNTKTFCSMHKAVFKNKSKIVRTSLSVGCVAAKAVNKCPPGIPIILPGEIINEEIKNKLLLNGIENIDVLE